MLSRIFCTSNKHVIRPLNPEFSILSQRIFDLTERVKKLERVQRETLEKNNKPVKTTQVDNDIFLL